MVEVSDPDSTYKYTYDLDGRMLTVNNAGTSGVPATIMTYTYDNVGNMLSMRDTINGTTGVTTGYQYDALDRNTRLTQGNKRVDYSYNPIGTHEGYTYDELKLRYANVNGNRTNTGYVTGANNRLLEDSEYRYTYDAVGRRTKKIDKTTNEVTEYTWDFRDPLTLH